MVVSLDFHKEIARNIFSWYKGKKLRPVKLQLNPTNMCNLKCPFCWLRDFPDLKYDDEVSGGRYEELIKEAKKLGIKEIQITGGGEPLMRKDLLNIMKTIKEHGIVGKLTTNGTLFNKRMVEAIVEMGWDEIVFSLDGPNEKINDMHRGVNGAFKASIEWIKCFLSSRKKDKPKLSIHMVLTSKNFEVLSEMFEFVHKLGLNNLSIEPIVLLATRTRSGEEFLFREEHTRRLMYSLEKAKLISRKYGFQSNVERLNVEMIKSTKNMKKVIEKQESPHELLSLMCYEPWYHIVIRPNGFVGPCCMFDRSPENIKEKSLNDVWFGEYFTKIRETISNKHLLPFCSKCNPSQVIDNIRIRECLQKMV